MAYGNNQQRGSYSGNRNNQSSAPKTSGSGEGKSKAVFTQLVKVSKTGKFTFSVGDKALSIPANTRITLVELSDKRKAALKAAMDAKGYKSVPATHELVGFIIESK